MNYEAFRDYIVANSLDWYYRRVGCKCGGSSTLCQYQMHYTEGGVETYCTIYKSCTHAEGINPTTEAERVADFEANHKAAAIDIT